MQPSDCILVLYVVTAPVHSIQPCLECIKYILTHYISNKEFLTSYIKGTVMLVLRV